MGRIRTIKPEFPHSESMGRVSREARLLFILLWTLADDAGRLRGTSRMLASLLYPYDGDAAKHIDAWIADLEREGCIVRYVIGDTSYVEVRNWLKHQRIDHPTPSKIPAFDEASRGLQEASRGAPLGLDLEGIGSGSGSGREGTIEPKPKPQTPRAGALGVYEEGFQAFWQAYGHKIGRHAAEKAWASLKPTGDTLEAIVAKARATSDANPSREFYKHPATWLNGRHWQDEVIPNRSAPINANGRTVVAASKQHIPNMPLGAASCQCPGCVDYRNRRAAQ